MARSSLSGFSVPVVTVLPTTPFNGQVVSYLADSTNGVIWNLRYRSTSASIYKWEFIGGHPITYEKISGTDTITSANPTYADLPTTGSGANLVNPLAGDYMADVGMQADNAADGQQVSLGIKPGAGATFEAINHRTGNWTSSHRKWRINIAAASTTMKVQAWTTSSGARIFYVTFHLTPIRVI